MSHVFISYSSKESAAAEKVYRYLEENHIPCWMAPKSIIPGASYASQIVGAIHACDLVVVLASQASNGSAHVCNEISLAFDERKVIIPFRLDDAPFSDDFQYFFGSKQWIDASGDFSAALYSLKETVLLTAPQAAKAAPAQPPVQPPVYAPQAANHLSYTSQAPNRKPTEPMERPAFTDPAAVKPPVKNKTVAALLAFFLGGFGIHKFYLKKPFWGVAYLLLCWTYIPSLLALIEGIILLAGRKDKLSQMYHCEFQ